MEQSKRTRKRDGGRNVDYDAASGIRSLVLVHGREKARDMVSAKQRSLVDIAAEVMADETRAIGFS